MQISLSFYWTADLNFLKLVRDRCAYSIACSSWFYFQLFVNVPDLAAAASVASVELRTCLYGVRMAIVRGPCHPSVTVLIVANCKQQISRQEAIQARGHTYSQGVYLGSCLHSVVCLQVAPKYAM